MHYILIRAFDFHGILVASHTSADNNLMRLKKQKTSITQSN